MSGRPAASCPTSRCSSTSIPSRGSGGSAAGGATAPSVRRSPSTGACGGATWRSGARSPSACASCARPRPRTWSPRRCARSSRSSCVALDAIRDQPRAVALLRRALETDRVAHAYAFVGPGGAGRMTTALAFAHALLCPSAGCGVCRACRLVLPRARALPATVVSRCQVVRFEPRSDQAEAALRAQAQALLAEVRAEGAEVMFRRTERLDRETAEGLVDAYWLFCRDLVLAKAGAPASLLADAGRVAELAREAETWTLDDLLGAIELCRQAREALLRNVAPRLTIEVILSRLALRAA